MLDGSRADSSAFVKTIPPSTTRSARKLAAWKHSPQSFVSKMPNVSPIISLIALRSSYRKFEDWAKEYGPVFKLRQGTTTIIVINRMQAAIDIMEKEGAALADRPAYISAGETLSGGMRLLLTPAGERFKKMRR